MTGRAVPHDPDDLTSDNNTDNTTSQVVTHKTYLARHGATDFNGMGDSAERIRGHLDVPLTDEGRGQATAMGKDLKDSGISMLFSSDLSRASETAALMSMEMGNIPVLPQQGLRPWKLGKGIEGEPVDQVMPMIDHLIDNPDDYREDGESFNTFKNRFMSSFNRIQSDYANDHVGIVTHYRGVKLLDGYIAGGKTGNIDMSVFRAKDTSCPPGSYRCMDKQTNIVGDKSLSISSVLYRDLTFEDGSLNPDTREISLSVSSDAPYERSFGTEVLDHSTDSIRLTRLANGAPLLFNHDPDKHIGRIMDAVTDGSKLRVRAKFSNSALGQEKYQDVLDGILKEASIGYAIHSMTEEPRGTFTATDWEPYESSLVTVPADPSVGIGRSSPMRLVRIHSTGHSRPVKVDSSKNEKANIMPEPIVNTPAPKVDIVAEREKAVADFQSACRRIDEFVLGIRYKKWQQKAEEIAAKHKNGKANYDEFRQECLTSFDPSKDIDIPDTKIGMNRKERGQFSVLKMIRDIAYYGSPQGLEKDACDTYRQKLDKMGDNRQDHIGYTLPDDITASRFDEDHDLDTRALGNVRDELYRLNRNLAASTGSTGGYLVGVDLLTGSIIELLRNKALVMNLGPTLLGGLVNNVAIPRVITGSTVYWLAEGASVTESDQSFGQLALTPHRLGIDTAYTKQLVNQSSLSVEAFVRDDMARQGAVERDRVFLNGGLNAGEPLGIFNTPGVQTLTFGATITWAKAVQFETDIEGANAMLGPMTYLTTPSSKSKAKTTFKGAASNFPIFIWEASDVPTINGVIGGEINGYPAYATKNMPGDKYLMGVMSEFIIADWAGIDVVVDPYSLKKQEQVEVTMSQWLDCGIRHPVAFEVSTDAGNQ